MPELIIYTTYFARLKDLPADIVPIAICGKSPSWYTGLQYKKLAPKYDFFMKWKETHDNEYYIKCFNEQVLNELSVNDVVAQLKQLAGSDKIALVCYEKPGDFCHRHLVAEWFVQHGIHCEEYNKRDHQ